jgi:hypothetical protein
LTGHVVKAANQKLPLFSGQAGLTDAVDSSHYLTVPELVLKSGSSSSSGESVLNTFKISKGTTSSCIFDKQH